MTQRTDELLARSFETLIVEECDLARVRRVEAGGAATDLWSKLVESGFLDALVSTERAGAGLTLLDATELLMVCGRHAVPLPVGQTMYARAALGTRALEVPSGPITFADHVVRQSDALTASVPFGMTAEWIWVDLEGAQYLLPAAAANRVRSGGYGSLCADLMWQSMPQAAIAIDRVAEQDLRIVGAALTAPLIAGAIERAVQMSVTYANDRRQFGKPIGRQQAIQQQLSVACELMYAAKTAASLGLCGHRVESLRAAMAKSRVSEAALTIANTVHAVHGAIGMTLEYDLQLFTRRLHEWRRDYGSESYWHGILGRAMLEADETPLPFVRTRLSYLDSES